MDVRTVPAGIAVAAAISIAGGSCGSAQGGTRFVRDEGHVAVFEHDGSSYDTETAPGEPNTGPRHAIARKFIETHGDFYDFLVVFTNFDFDRLGAKGVYHSVRNEVTGIGGTTFDNGATYGSARRLQGFIDLGPIAQYRTGGFSLDPKDPGFRATLGILAHEVGHRWLARVHYLEGSEVRSDLLGRDGSHWSYLLSSDASFLYGSRWEPIGSGRYRATEVQARYSALDLYLMGLVPPDEVPPLVLLRSADVDAAKTPELAATVSAAEEVVTVGQIVAAEGERSPSSASSQKEFRLGFLFLSEADVAASPLDLEAADRVRKAFVTTFFSLTRGRGLADTDLLNVIPPEPTAVADTSLALDWLLSRQQADGRFEDDPRTNVRDTSRALETLALVGVRGEPVSGAEAWLAARSHWTVDALSRAVAAGSPHAIEPLLLAQNTDGGFGLAAGYRTEPLDTALALLALTRRGAPDLPREAAASYLAAHPSSGGGWASIPGTGTPPDLLATCAAASALHEAEAETEAVQSALAWLVTAQQTDGGFGDGPSTPYATACAAELLLDAAAPSAAVDRALDYLGKTQRSDGSWEGSVFQTAEVLHALVPASFANLELRATDVVLDPSAPEVGESARIEVTVRNRSRVPAGSFRLDLFDGDPELGGLAIGSTEMASLTPGGASTAAYSWSTSGLEGAHVLVAVADMAGAVPELNLDDNRAARDVEVLPKLSNLTLESVSSVPSSPAEGTFAEIRVRVRNRGTLAASGSSLRLYEGHPSLGVVVSESPVPALASGEAFEASFAWDTAGKVGRRRLTAVADPERSLRERFETDNEAVLDVDVRPPLPPEPDLVVAKKDLTLEPARLSTIPQEVTLTAFVGNTGASPVPGANVSLYRGNPDSGGLLVESRSVDLPGDGGIATVFRLSVATGGTRTYWVVVDPANDVAERDEANNRASIDLVDPMDTVDLALDPSSLSLSSASLTSGETLLVGVDVGNRGTRRLSAAPVTLFVEAAAVSTASLDLSPGETRRVELSWKANRLGAIPVEVRADPDGRFSELDEDNNRAAASVDVTGSGLPNLTVGSASIETSPAVPVEGEPAAVSARIRNVGDVDVDVDAGAFTVSFFAGDPDNGGLRIGTAAVAPLAASSEVVAAAAWSEVNARGTTLLYVVVDEGAAVEEFDEADNRAFRVFDVTGLPDLSVSSTALQLDPPFARSGELLSIEAVFTNSGGQDAANVVAEIRLDDPVSGALLASETFSLVAPGEIASFSASWDTSGVEGEHALFLVLDVLGAVREQREDNNLARIQVALQDADLYVSPPYLSPDGNGVQDESTFFYRVAASPISVDVVDSDQVVVRRLVSGAAGTGSATWDGRNEVGVLARDGDYDFVLSSADGAELARRRVVLDTNRSSIAEALGSGYVGVANLTCPLPDAYQISGPAFLPDDAAAYFVSRSEGLPGYPAGLYRASVDGALLEPILTGAAFSSVRFFERALPFQAQRIVSPDGTEALATSDADGLALLDLATGALTPLGRFASDARWSPDGARVVASDRDGIYLYSAAGTFVSQISARGAELVEWSPDGSRIAYRPWEETVIRVMNADGSGDRALAASDARTLLAADGPVTPEGITVLQLLFTRGGGSVLFGWFHYSQEVYAGPFELDLDTESLTEIEPFREIASGQRWVADSYPPRVRRFGGRETRPLGVASVIHGPRWSYRDTYLSYEAPPEPGCIGDNQYLLRSLLNGEARFRLTALPSGFGVRITGTVADRNLDRYRLEYAPLSSPTALVPIQPPSSTPVVNDTLTTWIPPAPGEYIVRLTLRDRAGNEVVRLDRVSWTKTLPIAGLRRAPSAISPNGDGIQDEAIVEYNVLEPANLVFHVRDAEGAVVRTIVRDEAALGPVAFSWDGTDGTGVRVEDGRYVLEISGAEFPVLVDATPPAVSAEHSELYTRGLSLAVDLEGSVEDENLAAWSLVDSNGESHVDSVRPVGSSTTPALLIEAGIPIQGLELRATDAAGNLTAIPLTGPKPEVRVVSRRFRGEDVAVGPFEPGPAAPVPQASLLPTETFGWTAGVSFPTGDLRFLYHEEGQTGDDEIPAKRSPRLSAKDFPVGKRFVGHFESEGLSSRDVSFTVGPDAVFLDLDAFGVFLRLVSTVEEELVQGTLYMTVGVERTALRTYGPVPSSDTVTLPTLPCGTTASFYLEATGSSGKTYLSTTTAAYPRPAPVTMPASRCLGVADASIEAQGTPGAPLPATAVATLFQSLEAPESVALLLSDGTLTSEIARVAPTSERLEIPFDVSGLAEGRYTLGARADLPGGITREEDYRLTFDLDQSPPLTGILTPIEGGSACVVEEGGSEWVEMEIQAEDRRLSGFRIERAAPFGWAPVRTQPRGAPPSFPTTAYRGRLLAEIPRGLEGSQSFRLTFAADRFVGESSGIPSPPGIPPIWPNPRNNGAILGTTVRTVVILRKQTLENVGASPPLFSPNADGALDDTEITVDLAEPAAVTIRALRLADSTPVRTLASAVKKGTGTFSLVWDGGDDLGGVVADGEYRIEVVAVNGCGATSERDVRVDVDATAPVVEIVEPAALQPVAIGVEVRGTATDEHFLSYQLEFGEGESPVAFEPIGAPVDAARRDARLGSWSVGELPPALYTLRLSASDRAGNSASDAIVVDVRSPDLIESLGADEPLFSPNGDGVKDTVALAFRLKRDATVTLTILRPDETPVATLVSGESLLAGDHGSSWDGGVSDGEYLVELVAEDALLPGVSERARTTLEVDTTPPSLSVTAPVADSTVALPAGLLGTIDDPHLQRYSVELGPDDGALATLVEDSVPRSGLLASLVGLDDGGYRVEIHASDRAGNASESALHFFVDSTPPVVSLLSPAGGAFLPTSAGTVAIEGRLVETNLDFYALELGAGTAPPVFVPLASGTTRSSPEIAVDWDVSALPDGVYTLRLRATDQAGTAAETSRSVVLDGAPPTAEFEEPLDGAFVDRNARVVGTATDENFSEAILGVSASGAPPQNLARFETPVLDGVLQEGLPLQDGSYRLSLVARDRAGNEATVERSITIDTLPPAPPGELGATVEERSNVRLTWAPNEESDVAGYLVYRDGTRLTDEPIPLPGYLDANRPEGRFRYTVVALDRAGHASEPSPVVEARVDLTPPTVVLRSPDEGARVRGLVEIVGTAFAETDFKEYRVSVAPEPTPLSRTLLKRSPLPVTFATLVPWEAAALDGAYFLTLEGEDTSGNVATHRVRVVVDNDAPEPPILTSVAAAAAPEDVEIMWQFSPSPDVAGYLVYRNGAIANAPGVVSGDLRPFLVPGPSTVDAKLPDGRFCYRVVAMDLAGNLGSESNELCIVLDNRAPAAVIVEPESGARFDTPRNLGAVTPDEDVASVRFQYQPSGAPGWTDIGLDTDGPFELTWDVTGLAFGDYLLRAVATDGGGRTDPGPTPIDVVLGDATAPESPANLRSIVDGDAVTLTWDAVGAPDLAGYRVYRDGVLVSTVIDTTAVDAGRPDGLYHYDVAAFDADDNESTANESIDARVYAPLLLPAFPIFEAESIDLPGEGAEVDARVELFLQATSSLVAETTADADGRFAFAALALPVGESLLEARATDLEGNRSRLSEAVLLVRNEPPAPPSDLAGTVNGDTAELSWSASPEPDLSGYLVTRDGVSLSASPDGRILPSVDVPTTLTATASSGYAPYAFDDNPFSFWATSYEAAFTTAWLQVQLSAPRQIREVRLVWGGRFARDFRVLGEISGRMVPLAIVRGSTEAETRLEFPFAPSTAKIRVEILSVVEGAHWVEVSEVELYGSAPLADVSATDTPERSGLYRYEVAAIDLYGGNSAAPPVDLTVGDVVPPEPPADLVASVSLADVALSWTPSPSPDATSYRLYRDGAPLDPVSGTSATDANLPNGSYRYRVAALDAQGNESPLSNEVLAEVSVAAPVPPQLTVIPVAEGRALALDWTASTGPLGVSTYVLFRASVSGGPYAELAQVASPGVRDEGLSNGVSYFYVVRALDPRGEASDDSNEASGTPTDDAAPDAPILLGPTTAGAPLTVETRRVAIAGRAEPSTRIALYRGPDLVREIDAASSLVETGLVTLTVAGAERVLSADRMRLAEVGLGGIRLSDFATGAVRSVGFDTEGEVLDGAAFSPDGNRMAVATHSGASGALRIVDLASGATQVFLRGGGVGFPQWLDEDHVVLGEDNLLEIVTLSTGQLEVVYAALPYYLRTQFLLLSPDRSKLAFLVSSQLNVLDVATRTVTPAAFNFYGQFEWMSDHELALVDYQGVHLIDLDAGTNDLLPGTMEASVPSRVASGEVLVSRYTGDLLLVSSGGAVESLGMVADAELFAATGDFRSLWFESSGRGRLVAIPGWFEARDVALEPGTNVFRAIATDAGGNESEPSSPIEVVFEDSLLPDLLLEAPMLVVPAVPAPGDMVSVSFTARNVGASESPETVVQLSLVGSFGEVAPIGSALLPAIPAGGSALVTLSWSPAGLSGIFDLLATADPFASVDEKDESNNTLSQRVTVVAERGLGLTVATGLSSYSSGQDVEIRVEAVNGGPSADVDLETVVEDAAGNRLASVDRRRERLGYGEGTAYAVFWSTGSRPAGTYRARIVAAEASASASFEIRRLLDVHATIGTTRASYIQGSPVTLLATVSNGASNAPLRDAVLELSISDGSSQLVFQTETALPYLAIGGTRSTSAVWPRADVPPGPYTATLRILEAGEIVAAAAGSFEIRAATDAELTGSLGLDEEYVPVGAEVVARFTVTNTGVVAVTGGEVGVDLLDPDSGLLTPGDTLPLDLAPGESFIGELRIASGGQGLGRRFAILEANGISLASAPVHLFDIPSAPSANFPAEGAPAAQPLRLSVNNASNPNGDRLAYEFEIYLDDALRFLVGSGSGIVEGPNTTAWDSPLVLEENRRYLWRARARDRFAASDWMGPASFFSDTANDAPSAPSLSTPADESEVDTRTPLLSVVNGVDPEGAALTYTFEIYADPGLSELVVTLGPISEGAGETSALIATPLEEDRTYFWRARATDGELDSDWMPLASFRVNIANHPPTRPQPVAPAGGDAATLSPELSAKAGLDPERDVVTHRFEIDVSPSFDTAELQAAEGLFATGERVSFTPPVALTENAFYFWRVRASDGLASSEWSDVASFRVDVQNEPPSAPRASRPIGGAVVATTTPALVIVNAFDPEGDALRYDVEVYDETRTSLLASIAGLREGQGETAWVVSPRLAEDRSYVWRARATDGELASDWSLPETFLVNAMNAKPDAPSLGSPADGSLVSSLPVTLGVTNGADPDGDAFTYRFEVYRDENLTELVEASPEMSETPDRTFWEMSAALDENDVYFWRARAFDGSLESSWMPTARFRWSLVNEAPGAPVLVFPEDGAVVRETRPLLELDNATDPDGDPLHYVFEVYADAALTTLVIASPPLEMAEPRTSWRLTQDLVENDTYSWRAKATDGALESVSADVFQFDVNAVEEAPSAPIPLEPANGASATTRAPVLVVDNGASPDGRPLVYRFELYDATASALVAAEDVPEGSAETRWDVPLDLDPGATYSWRSRAIDDRGLASDWTDLWTFTVELPSTGCPPEWSEDFHLFASGDVPAGWRLRPEAGHPVFEVRSKRLVKRSPSRAAFVFEGSGEAYGWRNYQLEGVLIPEENGRRSKGDCGLSAGVVFYSTANGEYRLEVSGPRCRHPKARLVASSSSGVRLLAERELDEVEDDPISFHVEVANETGATRIVAELRSEEGSVSLSAEDTTEPLRAGTIGAWSDFVIASWDDFHVREIPGYESGISGDENGDGICDVESPSCDDPVDVCLDAGIVPVTCSGDCGHSGPTACGAKHSYFVKKKTGLLFTETPSVEAGSYRFRILLHPDERAGEPVVRVELDTGTSFDVAPGPDGERNDGEGDGPFSWSHGFEVELPSGVTTFRVRSLVKSTVFLEAFRLEPSCK